MTYLNSYLAVVPPPTIFSPTNQWLPGERLSRDVVRQESDELKVFSLFSTKEYKSRSIILNAMA